MKKALTIRFSGTPILIAASCLAVPVFFSTGSVTLAQDTDVLLQEVRATLSQPLPASPADIELPPAMSDEAVTQQLREMLFDHEAAGQVAQPGTLAATPTGGASTTRPTPQSINSSQVDVPDSLTDQTRVELPPAPPEKYAPPASQSRPAPLPNPATIPLPPHPPESQAPPTMQRPPVSLPGPAAPSPPPAGLPDPTVIPLPPHPPEEQAPWRQGV